MNAGFDLCVVCVQLQELFSSRNHKDCLSDVAISTSLGQAASCGDNW